MTSLSCARPGIDGVEACLSHLKRAEPQPGQRRRPPQIRVFFRRLMGQQEPKYFGGCPSSRGGRRTEIVDIDPGGCSCIATLQSRPPQGTRIPSGCCSSIRRIKREELWWSDIPGCGGSGGRCGGRGRKAPRARRFGSASDQRDRYDHRVRARKKSRGKRASIDRLCEINVMRRREKRRARTSLVQEGPGARGPDPERARWIRCAGRRVG